MPITSVMSLGTPACWARRSSWSPPVTASSCWSARASTRAALSSPPVCTAEAAARSVGGALDRVAATEVPALPASTPLTSRVPTSARASCCERPESGTGRGMPRPRTRLTVSMTVQIANCAQASHTTARSTASTVSKVTGWVRASRVGSPWGVRRRAGEQPQAHRDPDDQREQRDRGAERLEGGAPGVLGLGVAGEPLGSACGTVWVGSRAPASLDGAWVRRPCGPGHWVTAWAVADAEILNGGMPIRLSSLGATWSWAPTVTVSPSAGGVHGGVAEAAEVGPGAALGGPRVGADDVAGAQGDHVDLLRPGAGGLLDVVGQLHAGVDRVAAVDHEAGAGQQDDGEADDEDGRGAALAATDQAGAQRPCSTGGSSVLR